jgi:hypothetical protein
MRQMSMNAFPLTEVYGKFERLLCIKVSFYEMGETWFNI